MLHCGPHGPCPEHARIKTFWSFLVALEGRAGPFSFIGGMKGGPRWVTLLLDGYLLWLGVRIRFDST